MWDLVLLLVQEVRESSSSSQQRFGQEVWEFVLLLVQEVWDLVLLLLQEVIDFILLLAKRCETSSYF